MGKSVSYCATGTHTGNEKHNEGRHVSSPSLQRIIHASKIVDKETLQHPSKERWEEAEKRRLANASLEKAATNTRTIRNMYLFRNKTSCSSGLLATEISVTLVLQSTPARLGIMNHTCQRWKGRIILVLELTDQEQQKAADNMRIPERTRCPQLRVIVHVLNSTVNNRYCITPFKNVKSGARDSLNFYQSQIRINIEWAFVMFVARWG
jgi:hypothetical protein